MQCLNKKRMECIIKLRMTINYVTVINSRVLYQMITFFRDHARISHINATFSEGEKIADRNP